MTAVRTAETITALDVFLNSAKVGTIVRTPGDFNAFSLDPAFVGTLWLADKTATIGWTNKEYSQTLAKVSSIAETKARLEWIRKMQQIFMADLPVIGVISPGFHVAHRSDVDGFIWSATNTIRYQRLVRG